MILGLVALTYVAGISLYRGEVASLVFFSLPFVMFIDRFAAFFIVVVTIISTCVAIYSWSYVEHYASSTKKNLLVALMGSFILFMILVITSHDMLSFLIFWELMALASFLLVMFEYEKQETRKAGLFYFIMTQMSTVFLLLAFILFANATGSLALQTPSALTPTMGSIIFVLLFFGFGIKAGIIPLHKWLPYAHPASPSNVSALMSGVMIKVALYGLMRFVLMILPPQLWWGIVILIAGTISALLGVIYALKEHDIKRLLAYHSIENIGIILIGFGLAGILQWYQLGNLATLALAGSLFHILNHALFKSLLFLTAGSVVQATGTRNIEEMGGLIKVMPITATLFLVGAISIAALPPFNGFMSELMIFQAFFASGEIPNALMVIFLMVCLSLLALTSALAAVCFVKAFAITFLASPRSEHAAKAKEVHTSMLLGPALLALLCLGLGLFSYQIFSRIIDSSVLPNMLFIGIALLISYVVIVATLFFLASPKTRISETWGCGLISQNARMEYTASGFSEPIMNIFSLIYRPKKTIEREYAEPSKSIFTKGKAHFDLVKFFEAYLYMPVISLINRVSLVITKLHTGSLDTYTAYVFVAMVVLMILAGWLG